MYVMTTRFGNVPIEQVDVLRFEQGLIGMEKCREWVLLADITNDSLAWLQSLDRPEVALAVVSPRRFVKDYQIRVSSRDIAPLGSTSMKSLQVLAILNRHEDTLTLNLKAPIVVNLENNRGRQVVAKNDHEVQFVLGATIPMRRSA
ncbi:flagellar assembly protein FliW [Aeoliella mucimassa]|uniref:Flagellar assembly factor FliW n=1 Tax=Aeoliella mucimassa TaxID=2527972 RepID=A0A518ASC6_9BACT|nr:flagellar assembly protein FliW [Aeoliella mucimassa]QDU57631.1 Flagellar assembly factor FliW [Aeoliella mucimassa]